MRLSRRRVALGAVAVLMAAAGAALLSGRWSPWATGLAQGVDVSRHQETIDWPALAADDVRFVYIKATEGSDYVDPRFAANWAGAGAVGLARGAYHFFTLCRSGAEQADNFIRVVPRVEGALPHALDMEHLGPCRTRPALTDVAGEARVFLDRVAAHYGRRPIVYTTEPFHDLHLARMTGEGFWMRSLFVRPRARAGEWILWQHHNRGRRRGIVGPVDLNAFRGDAGAFAAWARSGR